MFKTYGVCDLCDLEKPLEDVSGDPACWVLGVPGWTTVSVKSFELLFCAECAGKPLREALTAALQRRQRPA